MVETLQLGNAIYVLAQTPKAWKVFWSCIRKLSIRPVKEGETSRR